MADFETVIDKTSKEVKRYGYCDFLNDGSFDSDTEEIIDGFFEFDPDYNYTYNVSTETFDKGSLITPLKTRVELLAEIMTDAEPTTQLPRLLNALDLYPSFAIALDNFNYLLARSRMGLALTNGDIIQDDYDLIDGILP